MFFSPMWELPPSGCSAARGRVDFPQAQTCCGQPHFNSGYHDDARMNRLAMIAEAIRRSVQCNITALAREVKRISLFEDDHDLAWSRPRT